MPWSTETAIEAGVLARTYLNHSSGSIPSALLVSLHMGKKMARNLAIISVALALYPQVVWAIVASNRGSEIDKAISIFLTYFPPFLRSISFITYATLVIAIAGVVFSSKWNNFSKGREKLATIIFLIISSLILLLTLFQLM